MPVCFILAQLMQKEGSKSLSLSIAALGVVYGDIGTSVLYAFKECLMHGLRTDREIIAVLSLIIWTLLTLVGLKYLSHIMRADNHGEGGILALMALVTGRIRRSGGPLVAAGLFGAYWLTRLMSGLLYEVSTTDGLT